MWFDWYLYNSGDCGLPALSSEKNSNTSLSGALLICALLPEVAASSNAKVMVRTDFIQQFFLELEFVVKLHVDAGDTKE